MQSEPDPAHINITILQNILSHIRVYINNFLIFSESSSPYKKINAVISKRGKNI
ncbi:hypothetical protein CLLU_25390 [Clostridium luticellarii]|jgi:hypothetical protein|uniref:Uncharacterized protein n=1 Tax=Clostridium luticellarii TaxID=1691940 RepID=A0A2T0BJB8_9CLOT|nr:hypothetical protein CLLU_25390 [Clostridium luticellarii]